jgi:hypothetical protein
MPRWMLQCPSCRRSFTHTLIEASIIEEARLDPFRILPKPLIRQDGETHTCPGCKTESVFKRHELFYREDGSDFVF